MDSYTVLCADFEKLFLPIFQDDPRCFSCRVVGNVRKKEGKEEMVGEMLE